MKKARHAFSVLLSTFLLSAAFHTSAQVVDISACRTIEDRLQRFDCYESLEATAPAAPQVAPTAAPAQPGIVDSTPAPAPAAAAAAEQPAVATPRSDQNVGTFGTRPETARARVEEDDNGRNELLDTVASLEQRGPNMWLITLVSGQKWAQMLSKRYPMNAGDAVRIYPTRFGQAYRLTATRLSGFIQVERVD